MTLYPQAAPAILPSGYSLTQAARHRFMGNCLPEHEDRAARVGLR